MTSPPTAAPTEPVPCETAAIVSLNPADPADTVLRIPAAGTAGATAAVGRARIAQPGWLADGSAARAAALCEAADALEADRDALAALVVREVGKPLTEAVAEIARTVAIWRYYAQLAYDPTGGVHEPCAGTGLLFTRRRPYGVAGLITPWNFPLAIPSWKAAPALAAGNTVVLKPAPEATACALRLADVLCGVLPPGALTVIPGGAAEGKAVLSAVDVVSFTGSDAVGRAVVAAATAEGIPVQAEMGGLNAALVLPDGNITSAAGHIASAIAGYAGQKCTATSRVIAVGTAYGPLRDALAEALGSVHATDPADALSVCGPVISGAAHERVTAARDSALAEGATVAAGGLAHRLRKPGWYVEPILLEGLPDDHALLNEEVFGPIAVLQRATDLSHAIALANQVRQGLVASLHTRDIDAALSAADRLETGMVRVNAPTTGVDFHVPFGGTKSSSHGPREQGRAAMDFYTASRTVTLLASGPPDSRPHRPATMHP
ncbi:aldehyde dehydrogenase family protein [Streptomyces sp. NPDC020800]|uniref:aldehyde dehydrogenase family protein n=1 Tax=Streptomyces sp. NPDC020800 TaxID=3365092 RepID=UPI00379F03DE